MFRKNDTSGFHEVADGVELKVLTHGDKTLTTQFRLTAGHSLPLHTHPHEQAGYLVSGRIVLTIGGTEWEAAPGDSWCIPGGVEHSARVLEESIAIEVFSPVREDYISLDAK